MLARWSQLRNQGIERIRDFFLSSHWEFVHRLLSWEMNPCLLSLLPVPYLDHLAWEPVRHGYQNIAMAKLEYAFEF